MRPPALKRLAAALAFLAGLWALQSVLESRRTADRSPLWREARRAVRLELGRPGGGGRAVLVRSGDSWRLKEPFDFPADAEAVGRLLEKLEGSRLSEPVSADPLRHARFELIASSAAVLRGWSREGSDPALDLLVGRRGADYGAVFVRRPGESEVREARGLMRQDVDRPPAEWADRLLCALPADSVVSVELSSPTAGLTLSREGGSWRMGGVVLSSATAAARVDPLLTALSRLNADAVAPEARAHPFVLKGLQNPELRARIGYLEAGERKVLELEIGRLMPGFRHPVRRKGTPGVLYELAPWRLEAFRLDVNDLTPGAAPSR